MKYIGVSEVQLGEEPCQIAKIYKKYLHYIKDMPLGRTHRVIERSKCQPAICIVAYINLSSK
jgi:hypothetical protein